MFGRHPDKLFTAYLHRELPRSKQERMESHLQRCPRCRQALDQLRETELLLADLPLLTAPPALWDRIFDNIPASSVSTESRTHPNVVTSQARPQRIRRGIVTLRWATLTLVVGLLALWPHRRHFTGINHPGPFWLVTTLAGAPEIDTSHIGKTEHLAVGQWLETDNHSRAEIAVADIGKVQIAPNTRIGLIEIKPNEHRLSLLHGEMSARVTAPPRVFMVETPAATAVDLGCAYTLKVDPNGNGMLHVTLGHVALPLPDVAGRPHREVTVPMDSYCSIHKGVGPGTPCSDYATPAFQKALQQFDFAQGGDTALNTLLKEAKELDTLTLWHLIYRGEAADAQRTRIIDRTLQLVPLPTGVTRTGLLKCDPDMLLAWHNDLSMHW